MSLPHLSFQHALHTCAAEGAVSVALPLPQLDCRCLLFTVRLAFRKGGLGFFCVALDGLRHLCLNLDGQPSEDPCPSPQQPSSVCVKRLLSSSPGAGVWGFASYPRGTDTFLDLGPEGRRDLAFILIPVTL